jgi:hypothetical protein
MTGQVNGARCGCGQNQHSGKKTNGHFYGLQFFSA